VLQQYGVHATFFCIGSQVQAYSAIVRQTVQAGNAVENHTWSHPNLTKLSPAAIRQQLSTTSAAIGQATGVAPTLFRPPYDATNATVRSIAVQLGLVQTTWTLDTYDWQRPGVATIVNTVLTHAYNGSIILLHDGGGDRSQTVQSLSQIITGLEQRGFTFTTL
jgi:peptidoglycan/xylan/chitin deacetylase (PgdA/CDA1 family)